jgi:hypothetical protein
MVPAPLARVWLGGVSAMGDFDKKFGEKKVAASVLCDDLDSLSAEGVTLFGYGLCTTVGGSRREFGQRLV